MNGIKWIYIYIYVGYILRGTLSLWTNKSSIPTILTAHLYLQCLGMGGERGWLAAVLYNTSTSHLAFKHMSLGWAPDPISTKPLPWALGIGRRKEKEIDR